MEPVVGRARLEWRKRQDAAWLERNGSRFYERMSASAQAPRKIAIQLALVDYKSTIKGTPDSFEENPGKHRR